MPRALRLCTTPGCAELVPVGRCPAHTRQTDQARGTRQARGYDADHDRLRAQWAPHVTAGRVTCWRCREPITAGTSWHLGHLDHDRTRYGGPEHTTCNLRAAGKASATRTTH